MQVGGEKRIIHRELDFGVTRFNCELGKVLEVGQPKQERLL